ncbi:hypothetical protein M422DRAFT_257271 [Sphaerobolus stellatus SS14]|uniref:Unplaced genomic scaffold SPHSTscaffold_73, whole genome shotgun sequence n=1 Tax=Sphaerobolus stellatus (strain SS14) TaxID=990650 RepID=A0A0C9UYM0_SPHS4|nr:hypothetical protein M422DRAFT_257271 [Sphaerobolus stellatus SS14]
MTGPLLPRPQQPAIRPKPPPLSTEQHKANVQKSQDKEEAIHEDVSELMEMINTRITELSKKHSNKNNYFRTRLYLTSEATRKKRKKSAFNAFMHLQAQKENADLPVGQKMGLVELVQSGAKKYEELTEVEKNEMIKVLETHTEGVEHGFRVSQRSRGQIIRHTMDQIHKQMLALKHQTGTSSFIFSARNNTSVDNKPFFYATDHASRDFVRLGMKRDIMDTGIQYEGYLINNLAGSASNRQARLKRVRTVCGLLIQKGLAVVTGLKDIRVIYSEAGYDRLVLKHGFALEGWPLSKFRAPGDISSIEELEALESALENGVCCWIEQTDEELKEVRERMEVHKKARKKKAPVEGDMSDSETSDAGSGKRKRSAKVKDARSVKKRRVSAATVDSDSNVSDAE